MNSMIRLSSVMNRVFIVTAFIMALAMTQTTVHAADEDGKVIFLIGSAWVEKPNGGKLQLTQGMGVITGDTIVTAENGQVHIRTSDGGYIAIMPNSRFLIENYKYSPQAGADTSGDVSQYQLLKGGFRSITGAIGQNNKQAYRVKTPVATIGIRGTDYTARLCEADCVDVNGTAMQDGLYLGVWQGGVTLTNSSGVLDVNVNQFGFVANANAVPTQRAPVAGNVLHAASGSATSSSTDVAANNSVDTNTSGINVTAGSDAQVASTGSNGSAGSVVALPSTGTATYTNTQNSSVTTSGNINGAENPTVTTATMTADFGTMTANATIQIDMTNETLDVTASNMAIDPNTATFGTSTNVTVISTDKATSTQSTPPITSATANGQFTGDSTPTGPTGANLSVDLQAYDPIQGDQQMQINTEMTKQ